MFGRGEAEGEAALLVLWLAASGTRTPWGRTQKPHLLVEPCCAKPVW